MRLLIVQFTDYAVTANAFARGGEETFYAQRYTVDFVAQLAQQGHAVRVIAVAEQSALQTLPSGVEACGIQLYPGRFRRPRTGELLRAAEQWRPTHLLLQTVAPSLLRWAARNQVAALPVFADSFAGGGLRRRFRHWRLASALNAPAIRWVANHGPNAAADLVRIGVQPRKVLPYDWPAFPPAHAPAAKPLPRDPRALHLIYVGRLVESKGVGDLIRAIALAKQAGEAHRATLVGAGDEAELRALARQQGVADEITFAGLVARTRVVELMSEADVVVVPSRHDSPEGMPMTIYEGLCSRSPLIVADHPMFRGRIEHGKTAVVFRAGDASALLDALHTLVREPGLYARLSADSETLCANFFGPLKWHELITRWLANTPSDDAWLSQYALAR